jgi:hypothetical protein
MICIFLHCITIIFHMGNFIGKYFTNESIKQLKIEFDILASQVHNKEPQYKTIGKSLSDRMFFGNATLGVLLKEGPLKMSIDEICRDISSHILYGITDYIDERNYDMYGHVPMKSSQVDEFFIQKKLNVDDLESRVNSLLAKQGVKIILKEPSTLQPWLLDPERQLNQFFIFRYDFKVLNK